MDVKQFKQFKMKNYKSFRSLLKIELNEINERFALGLLTPRERFLQEYEAKRFWNVRAVKMISK